MLRFTITDPDALKRILRAFAGLDAIRWGYSPNYNLINYCGDDLTADEKLLTHYLSYIMDRGMPFMRVWDIGGYVLSHMVRNFTRSSEPALAIVAGYVTPVARKDGPGITLECPLDGPNRRLAVLGVQGEKIGFASRYVPEDIVLILRTLEMLSRVSGRSLARFLSLTALGGEDLTEAVDHAAAALDGLTYGAAGTVSTSELPAKMRSVPEATRTDVDEILADPSAWCERRARSFRRFGKKRLWCSLRDYLKSPEFNSHFVQALKDIGHSNAERWHRDNPELRRALDRLELPGDVWNNNAVFADGLFMPYLENKRKTWDMPQTVREIYNLLTEDLRGSFYPEQLDVSFDFVPRMCERQMCQVCLFGGGVGRLCHRQTGLLCPVPLVACGYEHACNPEQCAFSGDSTRGICRHWQAVAAAAPPGA